MIINSLKIKNFRQFTNEQTIVFSTDPNKKVTIIEAESGVGKTTLIQCFQWILYGTSKYNSSLNEQIKQSMLPGESSTTECSINLIHKERKYTITRKQIFRKQNINISKDEDIFIVDIKDNNGITEQKRGKEASKIIKEIMHNDLFPYFFLEGESLTKVGQQMSKGKSGNNSEFVKAIKGLLGFNYLYAAKKHLKSISDDYQKEIQQNTNDKELKQIIKELEIANNEINNIDSRLETIDTEIDYNKQKREETNGKILQFSEVENKQKRRNTIHNELIDLNYRIQDQRRCIMKKFSSNVIYLAMDALLPIAEETLEKTDCLDKGIPGINVEAVEYMLHNHKCICGNELAEGSKEWNTLNDWITYLPPNNIGFEIENFTSEIKKIKKQSINFIEDFDKLRRDYNQLIKDYNKYIDEKKQLDEQISTNEDISHWKQMEKEYEGKVINLSTEKRSKIDRKKDLLEKITKLEERRNKFKIQDKKIEKLNKFYTESEYLRKQIERYCEKKEKEKRQALENAINEIFNDFYTEKIEFKIDENYGVQIKTLDDDLSEDFTSGGQDVAIALAFIGAIIKLIKEKDTDPETENLMDDDGEDYPLVMDAPTSNFGMKQMKSFSDIMPKITEQIIVFINDKDGPILKGQMQEQIGSEWMLIKNDTYHSEIKEVK